MIKKPAGGGWHHGRGIPQVKPADDPEKQVFGQKPKLFLAGQKRCFIRLFGDGSSLGNGNDTILSQGNYVRIDASGGDDQVLAAGQHHVEVTGGSGLDELVVAGQLSRLSYENVDGETHEIKAFGSLADMIKKHVIRKPIAG